MAHRWRAAIVTYSAAVSVKMNVLLMAPAVLIVLLKVRPCVPCLIIMRLNRWVSPDASAEGCSSQNTAALEWVLCGRAFLGVLGAL